MGVRTQVRATGGVERFPDGVKAPRQIWGSIQDEPDLPYDIEAEMELREGRYVATSLRSKSKEGGAPITGEHLRELPVAGILRLIALQGLLEQNGSLLRQSVTVRPPIAEASADAFGPTLASFLGPPPDVEEISDDVLQKVAAAYRLALLVGYPPVGSVAGHFKRPRPTAARWVTFARERGWLEEVPAGDDE
jgi:hypothetical protein